MSWCGMAEKKKWKENQLSLATLPITISLMKYFSSKILVVIYENGFQIFNNAVNKKNLIYSSSFTNFILLIWLL